MVHALSVILSKSSTVGAKYSKENLSDPAFFNLVPKKEEFPPNTSPRMYPRFKPSYAQPTNTKQFESPPKTPDRTIPQSKTSWNLDRANNRGKVFPEVQPTEDSDADSLPEISIIGVSNNPKLRVTNQLNCILLSRPNWNVL